MFWKGAVRVKERDRLRAADLEAALTNYAAEMQPLVGIADSGVRDVFLRQLIESLHRVEYPRRLLERPVSVRRTDPADLEYFDPIRAAIYHAMAGDHDEACWLVFLFVTYGKGKHVGWRLIRDVYGRLGQGARWDWYAALANPYAMEAWVIAHADDLWPRGTPRPFGAHRQHETIASSGRTIRTYVEWIGTHSHQTKFDAAASGADKRQAFDVLYNAMDDVYRYGRLAKFDYLAMLGKLGLAAVEAGSTYMRGATGPISGARLLFAGDPGATLSADWLEARLIDLDVRLRVGMQVLEDALCNWQKSPAEFKAFRG
jgi:hypothetical protein